MNRYRLHTLTDWQGGVVNNTVVNTLLYSYPNNFAALIPIAPVGVTTTYTGPQLFNGSGSVTKNGGNAWVNLPSAGGPAIPNQIGAMATIQSGDSLTIPVPIGIMSVQIIMAGIVPGNIYRFGDPVAQFGAIRNGCKASITVDGVFIAVVDTNNAVVSTPGLLIFDGTATHTIVVAHTGTQDVGVATPSMLAIVQVAMSTGGVVAGGVYSSPIMDSGDPETQWFSSKWSETPLPNAYPNPPNTSLISNVQVIAGQNLAVPTSPYHGSLIDATASGGIADGIVYQGGSVAAYNFKTAQANPRFGCVGYPSQAIGRYGQVVVTFSLTPITNPYLIDLDTYSWVPSYGRDDFLAYHFLPPQARMGPNLLGYIGSLAMLCADKMQAAQDVISSYAISTAASQYLPTIGADRGLPLYSGEDPDAYRRRILTATQAYSNGGSASNICQMVSILVNGQNETPVITTSSGHTVATAGGVVVTGGTNLTYTVSIPPAPYPGLVSVTIALARTIISDLVGRLNPVGFSPTVVFH